MYCTKLTIDKCFSSLRHQADLMLERCTNGIDISIVEHKNTRTLAQNRSLWVLYEHILEFWKETEFFIDNIKFPFLTTEMIHEYIKPRFNVKTTTRLSTKDFVLFFDTIQKEWVEQSKGFYEPLILPEKGYFEETGIIEKNFKKNEKRC